MTFLSSQLASASECLPCLPGQYCSNIGSLSPTNACAPGYYCLGGSVDSHGTSTAHPAGLPCPAGTYCLLGSSAPTLCPAGRFSSNIGNNQLTQCSLCAAGQFCAADGLTAPSGPCNAGYYCASGNAQASPLGGVQVQTVTIWLTPSTSASSQLAVGGDVCTTGHYCPNGTVAPVPCAAGSYNPFVGLDVPCPLTPAGYYTLSAAVSYTTYVFFGCC